ncbi:peptidase domain-containing ABC transporter [Pantoea sp. Mb-10]|uniref:peptidase domain-containing ABC transporter n=1 Tax=unclassified Pantoea TaxID=2630326 RepID=UPI001E32B124|nr:MULTISPECIES: peptidase domain-containing ABC transporter [unclassified Pantoea]MCE0489548.1 peptidase domain-containing ABC transporter [Pantoea sp. Mb-10]MCE0502076.1 peptidase domain-containing ABC transporter [Pantoea sp. Pb-8]
MNQHDPNAERPSRMEALSFWRRHRLPEILQAGAAECGLACLAMIACYHGYHIDLAALRRRFSLSLKGMTARQLIEAAHGLGLQCRAVRLDMDELGQLATPCVLHWDLDHFVVLARVSRRAAVIHDPAVGMRRISLDALASHFTGVAIEFSRGPTFRRRRADPPVSLRALAGAVRGLGKGLAVIFSMALVLELFALLAPLFMQMIVDQVLTDGDYDLLTFLGLSFLLLLLLETTVSALRSWSVIRLSTHFNLGWTGNVFQHLLRLPQSYFHARHLGDVVSRFGAIETIQQTLTTRFVEVILDGMMATLTAVALFVYNPLLAAITLVAMLIYGLLRYLYFRIYRESNLSQITTRAQQHSRFLELVRGIQTIRLYNQESGQTSRYLNVTANALNTSVAVQRLDMLFTALQNLTSGAQRIGVLWLGAWLGLKGQMTVGMLTAFVAYSDQFSSRVASLIDYGIELRMLRLQTERLADIVLTPPESHTHAGHVGPDPAPGIAFENVAFRYGEGEPWVLKNCSFVIQPGECVAIVGASGCGKSTLVRLLLGLLDPQQGIVRVGEMDLRRLGKAKYRAMTASVMQDDHLFSGSIADNITFFDDRATPQAIEDAARLAGVHNDIIAMPMGYHSLVGDMGSVLSGGQRQRLFLARALYKRPQILVMDEATSHLDVNLEKQVNRAIAALNITRILIAHRPETIAQADRVIELTRGMAQPRVTAVPQNGPEDAGTGEACGVPA